MVKSKMEDKENQIKEDYELMADGKIRYTFTTITSDFTNAEGDRIGDFHNVHVTYLDNKDIAVSHLEAQQESTKTSLDSLTKQLELNIVDLNLFKDLKSFDEKAAEVFKAIKEVKDFGTEQFVKENPKKYSKVLRNTNILKSNMVAHLTELDKQIRMYNDKIDKEAQVKLYSEQLDKIGRQLEHVRGL